MAQGNDKNKDRDRDTDTGLTGTGLGSGPGPAGSSPETTTGTRQPSQLAVLLATVGTPPLDAEQARVAAMNLFDQFVLASDRAELFFGANRSLFAPGEVPDPRHDALARMVRSLAGALRTRLEAHENLTGGRELLKSIPTLAAVHVEGALAGFDLRRGAPGLFSSDLMLGARLVPGVDPLESPDAGVVRRLLALTTRGLMVPKNNRSGGVVVDLGAVTLALGLLDLFANPRSALRAAKVRLGKSGRLAHDGSARVREVGQALRELMTHAVSSATQAGASGRDLVKENVLSNDLFELAAVALARAVYDGLGPDEEHPLVVPGADESDELTAAPIALPGNDESGANASGPVLGLYHRVAFVPLPYARAAGGDEPVPVNAATMVSSGPVLGGAAGARPSLRPSLPNKSTAMGMTLPAGAGFDEGSFQRTRDGVRAAGGVQRAATAVASVGASYEANLDAADPRHVWRRGPHASAASSLVRAADGDPSTQFACVVGARSHAGAEFLTALGGTLAQSGRWYALAPRVKDHLLAFEPLVAPTPGNAPPSPAAINNAASVLRKADLSRWLDEASLRSVDWNVEPNVNVVINAALLDAEPGGAPYAALLRLARDVADRVEPRAIIVLAGAASYLHAARALDVLARHPEAELGPAPLRPGTAWIIRADAPLAARTVTGNRGSDEALLATLAEPFTSSPALAELAARSALLPPEAKYRGRALRLAALSAAGATGAVALGDARKASERAAIEPWDGAAVRRALLAGVASHATARAAASAGLGYELAACARHELAVAVTEWEGAGARPHAARLADVARGQLVELVPLAHPRALLLAGDALLNAAGTVGRDWIEPSGPIDGAISGVLGAHAGGTVYARSEARGNTTPEGKPIMPLGFVFRGGGADVTALVDVSVGALGARPVPAPCMELHWRPMEGREASLGGVALALSALHDVLRRWNADAVGRATPHDKRPGFSVTVEAQLDTKLSPEVVRISIPLRDKTTAAELQRAVGELGARLVAAVGGDGPAEWTAVLNDPRAGSAPLPVGEALIAQECATRWTRALRVLPRHFPVGVAANARYAVETEIATASAMGQPGAVLAERRIPAATPEARALLAWLATAAPDVVHRAREIMASMPVTPAAMKGSDLELIDRALSVAWFLHANFCQGAPGPLRWSPQDLPSGAQTVPKLIDAAAFRGWVGRKVGRNAHVEQRATAALQSLEPSVVVES